MDSSAATAPLIVLGVAGFGLLLVALAAVLLLRPGPRTSATTSGSPPDAPRPVVEDDDLPAFHAHPPGSPGTPARATGGGPVPLATTATAGALALLDRDASPREPADSAGEGIRVTRFVLSLTALALVLVAAAAAAAVAAPSARAGSTPPPSGDSRRGAVIPDLPAVPDSPAPGQPGAGQLGHLSLPLGHGGTAARLSFGGIVLEQQAVGATMTRPEVSLTTSGSRALLHLRLPTWNCLAPEIPDDPAAAGCVSSVTEFADLPSPALSTSPDGRSLLVQGRVPSYTRPNGSEPVYTGRVYDVTLTVTPRRRLGPGRYVAEGVLTLGSETTRTDGNPQLDVLTRGR